MLHIIWSILNTIIFLYFIYIFLGFLIKGKEVLAVRFKMLSIIILILGLLQIILINKKSKDNICIEINEVSKIDNRSIITFLQY